MSSDTAPPNELDLAFVESLAGAICEPVTDALGVGVGVFAADGTILHMNPVACRFLGLALDELRGRPVTELFAPRAGLEYQRRIRSALASSEPLEVEEEVAFLDGTRTMRSTLTAWKPRPHLAAVVVVVSTDVTALRRAEQRYQLLAEHSSDVISLFDDRGRLLYTSPSVTALLGWSPEEIAGNDRLALIHPDDQARADAHLASALASGQPYQIEQRLRHRDGTWVWVECAVSFTPAEGERARQLVVTARDITARKAAQAQQITTDRLAALGRLAGGVAHEINNPLTYLMYGVDQLVESLDRREGADGPLTFAADEAADLLRTALQVRDGARRILRVVQNLRTFGFDDGLPADTASLEDATRAVLEVIGHELSLKARLEVDIAPCPAVRAARSQLFQVIVGIMSDAMRSVSELPAERGLVQVRTREERGLAVLEVEDNGRARGAAELPTAFDPFVVDGRGGLGAGLGLAMCHRLVQTLGGRIELTAGPELGNRFRVELPAASPAAARPVEAVRGARGVSASDAPPQASTRAPAPRPVVLVVDDDDLVRRSLVRMLAERFQTCEAASGRAAIELMKRQAEVDAVVCDLMMPDVTGVDVLEWVAEARPPLAKRLLFVTGSVESGAVVTAAQGSSAPVLGKPVKRDALVAALDALLS